MYDENKQNNSDNVDDVPEKYSFFCEYKGDENVTNVFWSVKNENGNDVPFMNDPDTELEKVTFNLSFDAFLFKFFYSYAAINK